jgi:hypothetical protein
MAFVEVGVEAVEAVEGTEAASATEAGSAAEELDENAPSGEHNLGNGNSMHLSEAQFKALLHSQAAVAAVMDRAGKCADIANSLAITTGARYAVSLQNKPDRSRTRAAVYAANFKAVIDELYHSTLLKAAAQTGSDPRQTSESHEGEHPHGEEHEAPVKGAAEAESTAEAAESTLGEL